MAPTPTHSIKSPPNKPFLKMDLKNCLSLLIIAATMLIVRVMGGADAPDERCQKNVDCASTGTDMCCGFKRALDATGEKGFTCMDRKDATRLNYQCLKDEHEFCDYCPIGFYCCSYETNLVYGLWAFCKSNVSVIAWKDPKINEYADYYRCLLKKDGVDYTSFATINRFSAASSVLALFIGVIATFY